MARQTIFDRPPHLYSKELTSAPFYINSLNERDISTDSQFHRSLTSRFELVIAASSANIVQCVIIGINYKSSAVLSLTVAKLQPQGTHLVALTLLII